MPTRLIRDAILTSGRVASLSWEAEVFYRRLMSVADDYGLYDARTPILRSALYPLQLDKMSEFNAASPRVRQRGLFCFILTMRSHT